MKSIWWIPLFILLVTPGGFVFAQAPDPDGSQPAFREPTLLSVELTLDRPAYFEGERITISAHLTYDGPNGIGGDPWSIGNHMRVIDAGGHETASIKVSFADQPRIPSADFTVPVAINGDFYSDKTSGLDSYFHLLPGHYTCRYTRNQIEASVAFEVLPVPDSLAESWAHYSRIMQVYDHERSLGLSKRAVLDTIIYHTQRLALTNAGSPYRNTGLAWGLKAYARARRDNKWQKGREAKLWTAADSLASLHLLELYSTDPGVRPYNVLSIVVDVFFSSMDNGRIAHAQALLDFGRAIGNAKLVQAAQKDFQNARNSEEQR